MTVAITPPPAPAPSRADPINFSARADAYHAWLPPAVQQMNEQNAENNALNAATVAQAAAATASAASAAAQASAAASSAAAAAASLNFRGAWSSLTGALNVPSTVAHLGRIWTLLNNLANVTTSVPGTDAANWLAVSTPARPSVRPTISIDWTLKPTAAALTAAGWSIARAGEITSLGMPTKALENLFVQSQTFSDAAWIKTEVTLTGVTHSSGLVGSSVVANAVNTFHSLRWTATAANVGSATYRVRFLLKAGAYTKAVIADHTASRAGAAFDLATGAIIGSGFGAGYVSHSITPHELGDGLYWCELVMTSAAAGTAWTPGVVGYPDSGATVTSTGATYAGNSTSGIEVYAAQLQQNFDGAYIPTTTTPITVFEPQLVTTAANELAYQHNANGECTGLVHYPADTNLLLRSQDLASVSWSKANLSVSTSKRNWAGSVPFWRIAKATTGTASINQTVAITAPAVGTPYTLTLALLADRWSGCTSANVGIRNISAGSWPVHSGVVVSGPGALSSFGAQPTAVSGLSTTVPTLLRLTVTIPAGATSIGALIYPENNSGAGTLGAAILVTRVHLSESPRLMPYIPTTSAAATRGAQTITLSGSAFAASVNAAQGTLLCSAAVEDLVFDAPREPVNIAQGASANFEHGISTNAATAVAIGQTVFAGTTQAAAATSASFSLSPVAAAYSFASNSFQAAAAGTLSAIDALGTIPPISQINIGNWAGLIQRVEVYPRAMTSAELQAITTPGVL